MLVSLFYQDSYLCSVFEKKCTASFQEEHSPIWLSNSRNVLTLVSLESPHHGVLWALPLWLLQVPRITPAAVPRQERSIEMLSNNHHGLFIYLSTELQTLIMQILPSYRNKQYTLVSKSEYTRRVQESSMKAWSTNVWTFPFP